MTRTPGRPFRALTLLRAYAAAGSPPVELAGWGSYEGWSDRVCATVVWLGLPDPGARRRRAGETWSRQRVDATSSCRRRAEEATPRRTHADGTSSFGPCAGEASSFDVHPSASQRPEAAAGGAHDTPRGLIHGLGELLEGLGGAASSREILDRLGEKGARGTSPCRYPTLRSALAELFPGLGPEALPTPTQLTARLRPLRGRPAGGAILEQGTRGEKGVRWCVQRLPKAPST